RPRPGPPRRGWRAPKTPPGGGEGASNAPLCAGSPRAPGASIEPQIDDVLRVGLQFAALDPGDDVGQDLVGRRRDADFPAFPHDKAVEELDLGAASLDHVLTHRRAMLAVSRAIGLGETAVVDFPGRAGRA